MGKFRFFLFGGFIVVLFVLIFVVVRYCSFSRGVEVLLFLGSWVCRWGVDRRGFGDVGFSHFPLISGSLGFLLSWSQVFVGARYYWRGWGGVGVYGGDLVLNLIVFLSLLCFGFLRV